MRTITKILSPKFKFLNSRRQTDAILENIVFGHNLTAGCSILANFCRRMQNSIIMTVKCEVFQNFEIQAGGRPSSWTLRSKLKQKSKLFIQDGGRPPFCKSSITTLRIVRFRTMTQNPTISGHFDAQGLSVKVLKCLLNLMRAFRPASRSVAHGRATTLPRRWFSTTRAS